ncbi:MAG: AMP-binding protein, partial [Bdellovibrionota bacterium]
MNLPIRTLEDYRRVYDYSLQQGDEFWAAIARDKVSWRKEWSRVSRCDFGSAKVQWFEGAELNVAENCLDRHVASGHGDETALIWVGNDLGEERRFTYRELAAEVARAANGLERLGVRKGDRVMIYLPNVPELAIAMLACARIGAIHSVIFGGFSAHSISTRIQDCGAKVVLTANGTMRGPKWIDLLANVREAVAACPGVETVVVLTRSSSRPWSPAARERRWEEVIHAGLPSEHVA